MSVETALWVRALHRFRAKFGYGECAQWGKRGQFGAKRETPIGVGHAVRCALLGVLFLLLIVPRPASPSSR